MKLVSCCNPKRVYNKYLGEYLWVGCGECSICKNRKASKWTFRLEQERLLHPYSFFVTLTYDEMHLPRLFLDGAFIEGKATLLQDPNRPDCPEFFLDYNYDIDWPQEDKDLFGSFLVDGVPYVSKTDIQLFHKRLNKWFFDNVTQKYKNFRYFLVSEYGSTTLRPHYHAIYFVDSAEVASRLSEGINICWKYGRIDCQAVESSASAYVSGYVNKSADLPSFYKSLPFRSFILCSRNPALGIGNQSNESLQEIFYSSTPKVLVRGAKDTQFKFVPLLSSLENRVFPKCCFFGSVSDSVRVQLYGISERFGRYKRFTDFLESLKFHLKNFFEDAIENFSEFFFTLDSIVDNFSEEGLNRIRRLYYVSKRVLNNCLSFNVSLTFYVKKICDFYCNKEYEVLKEFYQLQQDLVNNVRGFVSDDLSCLYPEHIYKMGYYFSDVRKDNKFFVMECKAADVKYMQFNRTKFKNAYIDSKLLKGENISLFNSLKKYFYAKKCYEVNQAFAT